MRATMPDFPLTITHLFRHGASYFGDSEVLTWTGDGARRATFGDVAERAGRLASALTDLGVSPDDRVATLGWNHQEHLEAYLAVPCMGAVLHTLNIRLFAEQLAYVIEHAQDRVVIADGSLGALLEPIADRIGCVEHLIVVGDGDVPQVGEVHRYEDLLASASPEFGWPDLREGAPAAMCYTSGTTGNPKGVVYSHRSTFLHSLGVMAGGSFALAERDRVLPVVPMFHANAWGLPYAGWAAGSDFLLPGPFLQAEHLARMIGAERPTFAAGVPTIWNDLLHYGDGREVDLSSLRMVMCGGAAVPRALMERFEQRYGVRIIQGWGMTETSPIAALAIPPKTAAPEEEFDWRSRTGRPLVGVELRIVADDGSVLPWDGESVGEIQVRGPWIIDSYYGDPAPEKFQDGWLRTGDVGYVDAKGYVQITDRSKDVIKSGGEWISSVELEGHLMAHPDVVEAAVIGVPDDRWTERPLACVVVRDGASLTPEALREFLAPRVARWWLPERWAFIDEVPKTSVGKFDKKVLRAKADQLEIATSEV